MATIFGISAFYHDSAVCLVIDCGIAAAAQEERFSRKKHDPRFPSRAIDACLRQAGQRIADIDYMVFYEKPLRKFDRLLETYLAFAPRGFDSFRTAIPVWLKEKMRLPSVIRKGLGDDLRAPIVFTDHHESHAASAFFPSPYDEAAILTLDGVGESSTDNDRHRAWPPHQAPAADPVPALPGPALLRFHLLLWIQGQQRRYKPMSLAPYGRPRSRTSSRAISSTWGPTAATGST